MTKPESVTLRRNLQQAKHCIEEALSVVERGEDLDCAIDDTEHAQSLLAFIVQRLKSHRVGR